MKYKVVVPMHPGLEAIETGRQTLQVNFPQRCVYCNGPVETHQIIDLSGGKTVGKRTASFTAKLLVPYCLDHSIVFSKYKKLLAAIGLPVFLIVFFGWFLLFKPLTEFGSSLPGGVNIFLIPLIFPCIGNLILGFLALTLVHLLLLLFEPKFRQIPFLTDDGGLVKRRGDTRTKATGAKQLRDELFGGEGGEPLSYRWSAVAASAVWRPRSSTLLISAAALVLPRQPCSYVFVVKTVGFLGLSIQLQV